MLILYIHIIQKYTNNIIFLEYYYNSYNILIINNLMYIM